MGLFDVSCETCGAALGAFMAEKHAQWHQEQDRRLEVLYLASCAESQQRLADLIAGAP